MKSKKQYSLARTERDPKSTQNDTPLLRFPRLAENDEETLNRERTKLVASIWQLFGTRRRMHVDFGRQFIQLKATFPHRGWESFYERNFASTHVSLRTVQRWMRLAREADAAAKNDSLSSFRPATNSLDGVL